MQQSDWNARYGAKDLVWGTEPNRFVAEALAGAEPGRALDLACGEGCNAIWLASLGWPVRGIDFSHVGLSKARRLAGQRGVSVEWVEADLLDHQPAQQAYDLVLMLYLHLDWDSMVVVLKRAVSAVAPGGTFLLVGHDRENLGAGYGGPPDAEVLYTADEVAGELTGLTIEKAERVVREVETGEGTKRALDCLVRARRP